MPHYGAGKALNFFSFGIDGQPRVQQKTGTASAAQIGGAVDLAVFSENDFGSVAQDQAVPSANSMFCVRAMRIHNRLKRDILIGKQSVSSFGVLPLSVQSRDACRWIIKNQFGRIHQSRGPPIVSQLAISKVLLGPLPLKDLPFNITGTKHYFSLLHEKKS